MNIKKNLSILFFIFSTLYLLSEILRIDLLVNISKLLLIPIITFRYFAYRKKRSLIFIAILFFCFLGDVALLFPFNKALPYVLFFFGICHLIFIRICFAMLKDVNVKKLIFSALPVIILWFVYYNYSLKDIFGKQLGDIYIPVLLHSIVLSIFTVMALVSYFNRESKETLHPVIISLSFVIVDVIIGVNKYVIDFRFFEITGILAQIIGYYFLMRFICEVDTRQLLLKRLN